MSTEINIIINLFMGLIIFSCIIFLAYVFTRFIGKKTSLAMKGKHMQVVETMSLGIDKNLYLIKVGGKYILLATAGKTVQFLADVDLQFEEGILEKKEESPSLVGVFENYLRKFFRVDGSSLFYRAEGKNSKTIPQSNNKIPQDIQKIKSTLEKLNGNGISGDDSSHE
ncbi:MAG: flagellar biosynthetic protein FliO [Clostridiaceae bacterium]|nr:flagellar biosynthetic protein FliO [Clostridiaceae bacterium]